MKALMLLLSMTACSFTAVVEEDAAQTDASNDVILAEDTNDAGVSDAGSPNDWVYNQPNLSLKFANCSKIIGDSSAPYLQMTYAFDAGVYKSAIPFYVCSNNLSPNCDIEKLVVNNNAFYATPTPSVYTGPNTLNADCSLSYSKETTAAYGGPGILYDWYYSVPSNCMADSGTLYTMMVLLYDENFQPTIDKNSAVNMVFACNCGVR
jgi:hypothetical protein